MALKLKNMYGKEFINKFLAGERDFSKIILEEGFNFNSYEGFNDMQDYLKKQKLSNNPLNISNSEFKYIQATGLYLPYTKGKGANLGGADLREADLREADLERAYLWRADLREADLGGANLREANLRGANLREADLGEADLGEANLRGADLREADLGEANLRGADLREANLREANLREANLGGANLGGVENLETTFNLISAHFNETKITKKEKKIIDKIRENRKEFIIK